MSGPAAYSTRLLEHGSFLTRLAHTGRYQRTIELASDVRNGVGLDFGCGDGMLLRRAHDHGILRAGYGVDNDARMRASAAERFVEVEGFQFIAPEQVSEAIPEGSCDLALCTETLEHVPDPERVLNIIVRCCHPGARVIITAPIEVGPSLIGKQFGRYLAGLKRPYGYEAYTTRELISAGVFWNTRAFPSSHDGAASVEVTGHKGFDYRELESAVAARMDIDRTVFSPLPFFGGALNSTVMWQCRTRRPAGT